MVEKRVTVPQFFSLLYLSMMGSGFMYISSSDITVASSDSLLRPFVFAVFSLLAAVPAYIVIKKQADMPPEKRKNLNKSVVYKTVSLIFAVVYFIDAIMTTARFDLFASSELFPGTDMTLFIVGLVVICSALALLDIGGLARASVIFTVVVVGATLFAALSLFKEVDMLNFTPLFENGVGKFFKDSLYFCIQGSEIGTVLLFAPQIKGNIKKGFIGWAVAVAVSLSFILFFVVGTLGVFADTQLFPTYSAVSLAEFGLLERLDALETAIWILCIVAKLTFYIMIVVKCMRFTLPKVSEKAVCAVCAVGISAIIAFVSGDVMRFGFISSKTVNTLIYAIPVVVLPCVLLIYTLIKRRKRSEKTV